MFVNCFFVFFCFCCYCCVLLPLVLRCYLSVLIVVVCSLLLFVVVYCLFIIFLLLSFFKTALAGYLSMEFESPQISRTFHSILADLNNAVIWIVSILLPISNCSNPLSNPVYITLFTISSAPMAMGTTVTIMFYSFINFMARFEYMLIFHFVLFLLWSTGTAK